MKQPTKENILKAHSDGCDDVKKVIENLWPDELDKKIEYYEDKIYAFYDNFNENIKVIHREAYEAGKFKGYKLTSGGTSNHERDSFKDTVESVSGSNKIEIFYNQKDFFTWALKQLS